MPYTYLKRLIAGCICFCLLASGLDGWAQEPATEVNEAEPTQTVTVEGTAPVDDLTQAPPTDLSDVDFDDPAVQEAYENLRALEDQTAEAQRQFGLAIQNQQALQKDTEIIDDGAPKPSLFDPENLKAKAQGAWETLLGWLKSPAFLAQIGAIFAAFILSPIIARQLRSRLFFFRDPPAEDIKLRVVRDYIYRARNFLRAIILVGLLALAAVILKSVGTPLGEDWLVKIAQGIAVVFLLYKAIAEFIPNPLVRKITTWIAIPLALLAVIGRFDDLINLLNSTTIIPMGDTPITAMTLVRLAIFGGLFFWLGNLSNSRGQTAIRSQEGLDSATREVVAKLFQILLFVIIVVLVMSFAGIPLSGLVMIISAVGLGIGLGLQPVAANFVSGIIILFDRSVRKGDFIVLPDGQEGFVEAINMRSTTVETTDGKDIMVPNTTFIDNTYENWTHKDPAQRYEVHFRVPYDTDIDKLEDILIPAIEGYDKVLMEPEEPDLELREFGEFGIHFAIEFWVSGIDDGENKFTSDLNFVVWRTLRDHGIRMPIPVHEIKTIK